MTPICTCKSPEPKTGSTSAPYCARCGHWIIETKEIPSKDQVVRQKLSQADITPGDVAVTDAEELARRRNPFVRFKCTSASCERSQVKSGAYLERLANNGCDKCGCKKIEVLDHPQRGHLVVDWRSQKSLQKKRRRVA